LQVWNPNIRGKEKVLSRYNV
jgi:hypothetical protein